MDDEVFDGDLRDVCSGCGRTIQDDDDMVAVDAMRRENSDVTEWHVVLCSDCHWRPEYSAHLNLVVRPNAASTP